VADIEQYIGCAPGIAGIQDASGKYVWLSPSSPQAWLGRSDREVQPLHLAEAIEKNTLDFRTDAAHGQVYEQRVVEGVERTFLVTRFVVGEDSMGVQGVDVTVTLAAETERATDENRANLAAMSAGIAHELSNPLSWLIGNLDYINREMNKWRNAPPAGSIADVQEAVEDAVAGTARLRAFVRELKTFSRMRPSLEAVDLHRVVDSAIQMAGREIRSTVSITRDLHKSPLVQADPALLEQVVLMLLHRAADSIPEGGDGRIAVSVFTAEDGRAVLEIFDSGPGIPGAVLKSIFEPFSTTKAGGMGLRLTLCQHIIAGFQGEIAARSRTGKGTTFRITLPVGFAIQPEPDVKIVLGKEEVGSSLRVMVVDDEVYVGSLLARMLPNHRVTAYQSGAEALAILREGAQVDVILCDLMMDGMTGVEFFAELKQLDGELTLRVVFMTGGAYTQEAQTFLKETANPCIPKPFNPRQLRSVVFSTGYARCNDETWS
jgi:signal transduction histidine kinase/CheY-like chemotaxis protein